MSHALNILTAMESYKCKVCGLPIGKDDAGSRVHLVCMEQEEDEDETSA